MWQEAYIKRFLERFQIHYSKPINVPVMKDLTLSLDQFPKTNDKIKRMRDVSYASAIGSLIYAMLCK